MWEENSIDSGGFSEISLPESSSDDYSNHVEVADEDVNVIRGAEREIRASSETLSRG